MARQGPDVLRGAIEFVEVFPDADRPMRLPIPGYCYPWLVGIHVQPPLCWFSPPSPHGWGGRGEEPMACGVGVVEAPVQGAAGILRVRQQVPGLGDMVSDCRRAWVFALQTAELDQIFEIFSRTHQPLQSD